jgi:hypothetical protein
LHRYCITNAWENRPVDGEIGDTEEPSETPKEVMPDEQSYRPVSRPHIRPPLPRIRLQEVPRPVPLAAAQVVAIPQVRQSPHARPEGVMSK